MFNKITCKKCKEKVSKKDSFCPNCGNYLAPYKKKKDEDDWGMLGKEDKIDEDPFSSPLFKGLGGGMLNKMLANTMKMLEKEMQKSLKDAERMAVDPSTNFELYINGKKVDPKNIKVTQMPLQFTEKKTITKNKPNKGKYISFNTEESKKFSSLPIKEPKTTLRRLSDKIMYEISVPGVKSINKVSIIKIGDSIEVKAISKENAYFKVIPINLDVQNFKLSNEVLVLELKE